MTGSAADADDLVQDTFARVMERPPAELHALRPWLTRVAVNLGRDLLRRRRRRRYVGPWLPSPVETEQHSEPPSHEPALPGGGTGEARYDLMESVAYAFLVALEALTPAQRAVLLLRDVFDYSVRDCAQALDLSEANVKTTHHRARRAMARYDLGRRRLTAELSERTRAALMRFLDGIVRQDVAAVEALLGDSVRALSDGAGEAVAARVPIVGRAKVARFYVNVARTPRPGAEYTLRTLNGLPAMVLTIDGAPRLVLRIEIDDDDRVVAVHSVIARAKLSGLAPRAS
jgi:RNA polymerase sigma-70 factor (ECF subfamily)